AACTLARSPYFVTRYPKASDTSSPPCLLRLLLAGAVAGWGLHPLESAALSRRTPEAAIRLPYSITSVARARIDGGTVRPSAWAVLRLTTSSNVVGCWTGRSAGLAPLRIFPV